MKHDPVEILELVANLKIPFSKDQAQLAAKYLDLVWGQSHRVNLVSSRDQNRLVKRHFIDSLRPLQHISLPRGAQALDLGSGAGFPGIPLKITRPDLKMILADSSKKKADFLRNAISALHLGEAKIENVRIGDRSRNLPCVDICFARAVAELRDILKACKGILKPGGIACIFKHANNIDVERKRLESASVFRHFSLDDTIEYRNEPKEALFCLVLLRKR